jgi:dTDP-glucose 4,6-dehydratase
MRALIAGGAGFIGSNFVRHLLANYEDLNVLIFDLLTYAGRLENLQDVKRDPRCKFTRGDIRDREAVAELMKEGVDLVVNFAAETHVDRSVVEPGSFVLTDVYGTYILLEAARRYEVKRFVQISTDEVYGSPMKGSSKETDMLDPSSPYSASKAAADHIALAFHKTYGTPVIITRSSNNYGPYQHPEKLIPKLILRALRNEPLPIYGDGRQVRDWLHVADNCAAIDLVAQKGGAGQVYNIASSEEQTNMDVSKSILKLMKKPESLIKQVPDRPGHDRRYSLNVARTKALGWKPRISFEEGLGRTVDWYLDNRWWWQPLVENEFFKADTPWLR